MSSILLGNAASGLPTTEQIFENPLGQAPIYTFTTSSPVNVAIGSIYQDTNTNDYIVQQTVIGGTSIRLQSLQSPPTFVAPPAGPSTLTFEYAPAPGENTPTITYSTFVTTIPYVPPTFQMLFNSPYSIGLGDVYTSPNGSTYTSTEATSSSTTAYFTGTGPLGSWSIPNLNQYTLTKTSGSGPSTIQVYDYGVLQLYTPTAPNITSIRVRGFAGGAGGSASGSTPATPTNDGGPGNGTIFGVYPVNLNDGAGLLMWAAGGGQGSVSAGSGFIYGGLGGGVQTSPIPFNGISGVSGPGNGGQAGVYLGPGTTALFPGGGGGISSFGSVGGGTSGPSQANPSAGYGVGGSGGGGNSAGSAAYSGSGGGAGSWFDYTISGAALAAIIASGAHIAVGFGGYAGPAAGAGTFNFSGSPGTNGFVSITEYY
jgi:hypothetical protein